MKSRKKPPEPAPPSRDDTTVLKRLLAPLLREIGAKWILLVDLEGQAVAQHGEPGRFSLSELAPIMAASFATMAAIARHFGGDFAVMLHQGKRDTVQLSLVGQKMILAMVFGNHAPVGAARLCAQQVTRKLEAALPRSTPAKGALRPEYVDAVKARLDELLG